MALSAGDSKASSGMSKAIYDQLNTLLSPSIPAATLPQSQTSWQQLAFAIATGVVQHIVSNMEINNIQTGGAISVSISQVNGAAATGTAGGSVTLNQSGSTSGHVT
jgi:hypothetical protein